MITKRVGAWRRRGMGGFGGRSGSFGGMAA